MAYIDMDIEEYPYEGKFFRTEIDMSLPLDQRTEKEIDILVTRCDIQEAGSTVTGGIANASFSVYFPIPDNGIMPVRSGHKFRGIYYGMTVDGEVNGVFPNQLGGCVAYLKDKDS